MRKSDDLPDEVVLSVTIGTIRIPPLAVAVLTTPKSAALKAARAKALRLVGKEFDATVKRARAEWRKLSEGRG